METNTQNNLKHVIKKYGIIILKTQKNSKMLYIKTCNIF